MSQPQHSQAQGPAFLRFLASIARLDRRWIFLSVALAIAVPMLLRARFPEVPGPMSRATFDAIEAVPEGSRVLIAFDYDPPSAAELQPMADAIVHHCASRGHKIVFMALWPFGKQIADKSIRKILGEFHPHMREGTDWVQLGFKTGNEGVIKLMSTSVVEQYQTDASGVPLSEIPLMKDVSSLRDFKLVVSISGGNPGTKEWVQYGNGPMPDAFTLVSGTTGVQASQLLPYYPSQLEGLLIAVKGAAEYETLVTEKYPVDRYPERLGQGRVRMGPQLVAHLLIVGLILLGNVAMLAGRMLRGGAR